MLFRVILDVSVAMLSGFGFYCALRTVVDMLWSPKQLYVAIEVRTSEDADMLDVLLHEAYAAFFRKGKQIVVLFSNELMNGTVGEGEQLYDKYSDLLDTYGADCYLIDP